MEKLTKQEDIEIESLISYCDSLIHDVEGIDGEKCAGNPHAERDTLRGLIKLKNLHDKKFK